MGKEIFQSDQWGRTEIAVAAIVVVVTGLLLYWISQLTVFRRGGSRRLPPGPRGWPLLGALPYMGEFVHKSLYELSKQYGPVMYLRMGSVPTLVISSAEMAKEVLKTNDHIFASRPLLVGASYFNYGSQDISFTPYGPHWRQARKFSTLQLLTNSKIAHFMGVIKQEILTSIHLLLEQSQADGNDGAKVNVTAITFGMTMNVITQMMWNKRHRNIKGSQSHVDDKFTEISEALEELLVSSSIVDFLPFFKSLASHLSGLDRKAKALHKELDEFCESVICEKEQALLKETNTVTDEDDFVTTMLKLMAQPGDSEGLSRGRMKAILTDLLFAAADTSATTFDWTLAELMKHPDMVRKVQDELTAVVGEDRLVRESDIPQLKYLDAVLKEVLRKHSPAWVGIPHLSMADCKVGGYDIPANTWVVVNQYPIHHDPTVWESPWEFNPDRFLQSHLDYKGHNFEFIPFSSGRRGCPGINLASTFLHNALAQFLHTLKLSLPEGQKPESVDLSEQAGIVVGRKNPLFITAKPRLAHHIIYPTTP